MNVKKIAELKKSEFLTTDSELLEAVSCGIFAYTLPEHRIIALNRTASELMGIGEGCSFCGFTDFIDKKVLPHCREDLKTAADSLRSVGDSTKLAFSAQSQNGIIFIEAVISFNRLSDGTDYLMYTLTDSTASVRAAEESERHHRKHSEALSIICEYSFSFTLSDGIIREQLYNARKIDILKILGLSLPLSYDELNAAYEKAFGIEFQEGERKEYFSCEGLRNAYEEGKNKVFLEYYSRKTNKYTREIISMYPDAADERVNVFIVAIDVTEMCRKKQEQAEALAEANRKLDKAENGTNTAVEAVLDSINGGVRIIDPENKKYISVSEGSARIHGYTSEEFMARYSRYALGNVYPPDRHIAFDEAASQANENGAYNVKYRITDRWGNIKWVSDNGKVVSGTNGSRYFCSVIQDITELENRNIRLNDALKMQEKMADCFSTGVFAYTLPQRKLLIVNQAVRDMFGYEGTNLAVFSHSIMERVADEDREAVAKAVKKLKKPGDTAEYTFHATKYDGSDITVRSLTKLLKFDNGQKFILSSMMDITEQENAVLNDDEERLLSREALISDGEIFFTIDLSDGMCSKPVMSENAGKIFSSFGVTMPMRYDEFASACFSGSRTEPVTGDIESLRSCEVLLEQYKNGVSRIDVEYHVPDNGSYFRVTVLFNELSRNNHICASMIIHDVTAEKKANKYSRAIIESLGEIYSGVYYISLKGRYYTAVKQHGDIATHVPENGNFAEFEKVYFEEYIYSEDREITDRFFNLKTLPQRLKTVSSVSAEFRRKDLGWCRGTFAAAGRDSKGKVTAVVYACYAIDEEKRESHESQEALRSAYESANLENSVKNILISNMSQGIAVPANTIAGMCAIAETHMNDKERVSDCLSKINAASKQLLVLVNEIIDMSKIESGSLEFHNEFFNLPELIDNLVIMTKSAVKAKKHRLTVSVKDIVHENVVGDSRRIQQVFYNIMSNAVRYTPNGGRISVAVTEKPSDKQGMACYKLVFRDNGVGMSEEFLSRIYEPFAHSNRYSQSDEMYGVGLGMPIVRSIVRMMDGTINIESTLGKGTAVTVELCLKIENDSLPIYDDRFKGLRVLIVDEDGENAGAAGEILSELGMKCDWVRDGSTAVQKNIERHSVGDDYFAVIIDRSCREIDCISAIKEIRSRICGKTPAIIVSAAEWSDIETEAKSAGANAFISKPMFRSRLLHLFNELMDGVTDAQTDVPHDSKLRDFSSRRALLAEDDELSAEIAGEILSLAGLKVEYVVSGAEAVERIANAEDDFFDIVFMDIQMPVMNGYDAARAIRALPGGYPKCVPIIAMSANTSAEDIGAAKNAGMNEHISKPLDFDRLLQVLKTWLGQE